MNSVKKLKNIILDLDLTLICSIEINDRSNIDSSLEYKEMKNYYRIYSRPHLQTFLSYIFSNYNVSVWTAASKDYAMFVIKNFILAPDPSRKFQWIFFSYHCEESKKSTGFSKKIDFLKKDCKIKNITTNNSLIIDDNMDVYDCQKDNCYLIKPFECQYKGSSTDTELVRLVEYLKTKAF